jgi:hypothetical protein
MVGMDTEQSNHIDISSIERKYSSHQPKHSLYAVRISGDSHPNYIGPLTYPQVDELGNRLTAAGYSWEAGLLSEESDLPGLWM